MPTNYKFTDFDIDFTRNNFTNDLSLKTDRNSIRQSIMNLILTRPGEKPFNRNFGVGVHDLLFETPSSTDFQRLEMDIKHEIILREPRAEVKSVVFDSSKVDANELTITINYIVRQGLQAKPILDSLQIEITKVR
tara:strand:- start:254 stop:658 length:405 start_codon:yes stop_codon:yes gene_type:complete